MVKRVNQKCSAIFYCSPKQCNFVPSASRLPCTIDVIFWIWQTASKFGQHKLVMKKQPGDLSQSDWEIFWMSINLWWRGKDSVAKIVQQQVCILWRGLLIYRISILEIFLLVITWLWKCELKHGIVWDSRPINQMRCHVIVCAHGQNGWCCVERQRIDGMWSRPISIQ